MSDENKKNENKPEEMDEEILSAKEFIERVKKDLTGNPEIDLLVLNTLYEAVRDDLPEHKEAVWNLLNEMAPDELKKKNEAEKKPIKTVIQNVGSDYTVLPENVRLHKPETLEELSLDSILKAQELIDEGRMLEAFVEISSTIVAFEKEGFIKESLEKKERNFNHPIEREYVRQMKLDERPEGEIQFGRLFNRSGFLMHDMGHIKESVDELKRSLIWDPNDFGTLLELANSYKALNDPARTFSYADGALQYAFEPRQISAAWRSMGFALIELELYAEAAACFYEALRYEPESEVAKNELDYISYKAGLGIPEKDMNTTIEMSNELEIDLKKPYKMYQFLDKVAKESDDKNLRDYAKMTSESLKPMVDSLLKDIDNAKVELKEIQEDN